MAFGNNLPDVAVGGERRVDPFAVVGQKFELLVVGVAAIPGIFLEKSDFLLKVAKNASVSVMTIATLLVAKIASVSVMTIVSISVMRIEVGLKAMIQLVLRPKIEAVLEVQAPILFVLVLVMMTPSALASFLAMVVSVQVRMTALDLAMVESELVLLTVVLVLVTVASVKVRMAALGLLTTV